MVRVTHLTIILIFKLWKNMTLIPKSIASDMIKFNKFNHYSRFVFLPIFLIFSSIKPIPFLILFILLVINAYYTYMIISSMVYEVIESDDGIKVTKGRIIADISYQDILSVNYKYSYFVLAENIVTLKIKPHSQLGDTIRFISWADTCNYNKEFTLNPYAKTPETQAWIERLKQKINTHTTEAK